MASSQGKRRSMMQLARGDRGRGVKHGGASRLGGERMNRGRSMVEEGYQLLFVAVFSRMEDI